MSKRSKGKGAGIAALSQQMKRSTRVEELENLVSLIVRDLNAFQQHVNFLGKVIQATVNVLGQGAVNAEMERLASAEQAPPPVPVAEQAAAEEQKVEEASALP